METPVQAQKLWRSPTSRGKRGGGAAGGCAAEAAEQQSGSSSSLDVGLLRQLEPLAALSPETVAAAATDANLGDNKAITARLQVRIRASSSEPAAA